MNLKAAHQRELEDNDERYGFYVTARSMYLLNLSQFHPSLPNRSQAVFRKYTKGNPDRIPYSPSISSLEGLL